MLLCGKRYDQRMGNMATLDWSQCSAVESVPGRLGGAWVFRDTRMPVSAVFENLEAGASVDDIIPRSPHNPKILWVDDAKIVGDRIAEVRPVPWNLFTQEPERRVRELSTCGVARVVGDVSVHEAPQPFDRIEMRTIGRDEIQFDPAPRPGKPFLHQLGMMIARVVEKDMD